HADKHEPPDDRHIDVPHISLDQCTCESGQCEERSRDAAVERPIASEVDKARRSKRDEKQRISKRLKSGPARSEQQTRAVHKNKHCRPETHRAWCCAAASR